MNPILAEYGQRALPCVSTSCTGPAPRVAPQADGPVVVEAWWTRTCDSPCCHIAYEACQEDVTEAFFACMAAEAYAIATTGPLAFPGVLICVSWLVYGMEKCRAREGCVDGIGCLPDNTCCPTPTCNGACCPEGTTCTYGSYQGTPRAICCAVGPNDLGACDGVCCGTPAALTKCCPGKSNPCVANHVAC
ncbi:MAG: hypothetical protein QM692_13590 [Thermomicrobiales bacterium]